MEVVEARLRVSFYSVSKKETAPTHSPYRSRLNDEKRSRPNKNSKYLVTNKVLFVPLHLEKKIII